MFIDETLIHVKAGQGGNGAVGFRREKFVPFGGPDGGNGGRGGHVVLQCSTHIHTLYDIGNSRTFRAESGQAGSGSLSTGRNGEDIVVAVPLGTLVKDAETGEILADLKEDGQTFLAAEGGKGGLGNATFKSSTNRAPRKATPGKKGVERKLQLELKLLADCALVGFPNAGKSSLLRKVSAATPKVADYPFTTLKPGLGVVSAGEGRSFVLVDIPGLVEGAAEGKGLGHQFLRHIERASCLAFVLDRQKENLLEQYRILAAELRRFHPLLLQKPRLVLINKMDLGEIEIPPPAAFSQAEKEREREEMETGGEDEDGAEKSGAEREGTQKDGGEKEGAQKAEGDPQGENLKVVPCSALSGEGLQAFKEEALKLIGDRGLHARHGFAG